MLSEWVGNIAVWLSDNKLFLHLEKTQLRQYSEVSAQAGQTVTAATTTIDYLCCMLDNQLTEEATALKALCKICEKSQFLARKAALLV